ncbi:MAG TPA: TlyA family RNA methyltransferase [Solirubrobacteraceae bacterium]|jgi:23S rRNA (cytidine1920-2'-O)/16S rRNA (cytidine1409-2'-O)-methyltransferase|nr:TlyA family RNA methyltransferase [Solirubrobacteraceae bacterium]
MAKRRLDALLADRGLFESRSRAAASVLAGEVRIGPHGARAAKPGQLVADDAELHVDDRPRYVSRGGLKLANALATSRIDPTGRSCLDVGASTGGFTDCLLQAGAARVTTLDVAYGELAWSIRTDPRVTVIERTNARYVQRSTLPYAPDLIVVDVSFISLRTVLGPVLATAAGRFDVLAMIKPQFELGRGRVGKGGVVGRPADRREALIAVGEAARALGVAVLGFHSSGLPGPKGNQETFIALADPNRLADAPARSIEALALEVEPA